MANIKQQKKRIKTDKLKKATARSFRSKVRTIVLKTNKEIAKNSTIAKSSLENAKKMIDKLVTKGIKKINYASRKKSQLDKKFNNLKKKETSNKKDV